MVNKTKINVYLIKEDFDRLQIINKKKWEQTKQLSSTDCHCDSISATCQIYSYTLKDNECKPAWVGSFFNEHLNKLQFCKASAGALVVISVQTKEDGERYFALPFGYGVHLINKDAIEERFGLKTVLSLTPKTDFRQVKRTNIAGAALRASEQMPRKSSISEFSVDPERDLLDAVTVTTENKYGIQGNIIGADFFGASVKFNLDETDEVNEFLINLYTDYHSKKYQEDFPWIDHISLIENKSRIELLEKKVVEEINKGSEQIWMAVPEIVEWGEIAGFKYSEAGELHDDIILSEVIHSFKHTIFEKFDQLKSKRILGIDNNLNNIRYTWTAARCLCGEFTFEEHQYCVNNGRWFEIDDTYAKKVNNQYKRLNKETDTSEIEFIDYSKRDVGYDEGEYNKELANSRKDFILMDKRMIAIRDDDKDDKYYGKFELCDVLSKGGLFIHIKRYSGSATLSHLFNQGLVSAQLVKSDKEVLKKANVEINKAINEENEGEQYDLNSETIKQVIFGIIKKKDENESELPDIPFFSKITFLSVKGLLEGMGIGVKIKRINIKDKNE